MKKIKVIISTLVILSALCINFKNISALENLSTYNEIISSVNKEYNSSLYIMSEQEFLISPLTDTYNFQYSLYINNILNTDIVTFKNECISLASISSTINVSAHTNNRSTLAKKTVSFNSGRNSMTLTYKYSGSKFDTTYKPTATVNKLSASSYFSMTSYSGSFKNSNTTYSVVAKGKLYSNTVVSSKSFTVNFNL